MTINQLLFNHQLAKINAAAAMSASDRDCHFDLVGHYAKRIAAWRRSQGLSIAGWPLDERR